MERHSSSEAEMEQMNRNAPLVYITIYKSPEPLIYRLRRVVIRTQSRVPRFVYLKGIASMLSKRFSGSQRAETRNHGQLAEILTLHISLA